MAGYQRDGTRDPVPFVGHDRQTRSRRTKAEMGRIRDAILAELTAEHPMTVRQLYYRLVSAGEIEKTEASYKSIVVRLTGEMRWAEEIPFGWIVDSTRLMRKPRSFSGLADLAESSQRMYRRDIWGEQPVYCEIWCEKDTLSGTLYEATAEWDVPLMICRGYPSLSFLAGAAETIRDVGKPAHLYYLGDYDPSGLDIPRKIEVDLRRLAPKAEIHFERVAVTPAQIKQWRLPTRPTKRSDSRARGFKGESVEVDAIPPSDLRDLVRKCIEQHIDSRTLDRTRAIESAERDALQTMLRFIPSDRDLWNKTRAWHRWCEVFKGNPPTKRWAEAVAVAKKGSPDATDHTYLEAAWSERDMTAEHWRRVADAADLAAPKKRRKSA